MGLRIDDRRVRDQVELAEPGRQLDNELALDEPFTLSAMLDEILNRTHLEPVLPAKLAQKRQSRHRAIGIHYFANDGRFLEAGEPREIDASLGMPCANEDAAVLRTQAVHVTLAAD